MVKVSFFLFFCFFFLIFQLKGIVFSFKEKQLQAFFPFLKSVKLLEIYFSNNLSKVSFHWQNEKGDNFYFYDFKTKDKKGEELFLSDQKVYFKNVSTGILKAEFFLRDSFLYNFIFSYPKKKLNIRKLDFYSYLYLSLADDIKHFFELPFAGLEEKFFFENWNGEVLFILSDTGQMALWLGEKENSPLIKKSFLSYFSDYFEESGIYLVNFLEKKIYVFFRGKGIFLSSSLDFFPDINSFFQYFKKEKKFLNTPVGVLSLTPTQLKVLFFKYFSNLKKDKIKINFSWEEFFLGEYMLPSLKVFLYRGKENLKIEIVLSKKGA